MAELVKGQAYRDASDGSVFRLLYIDVDAGVAYIINLSSNASLPYMVELEPLQTGLDSGLIAPTMPDMEQNLSSFNALNARQQEQMANRWGYIRSFVCNEPVCFQEYPRSKFIQALHQETGLSDSSIRRILHRYWASGGSIIAIAPRFDLRGRHKYQQ